MCMARRPTSSRRCAITATLDNNERTQLGLDINDIVQGEVGVEVRSPAMRRASGDVHVRADLANAEVFLESLAWHKPKGRPSVFEFDLPRAAFIRPSCAM